MMSPNMSSWEDICVLQKLRPFLIRTDIDISGVIRTSFTARHQNIWWGAQHNCPESSEKSSKTLRKSLSMFMEICMKVEGMLVGHYVSM